MNFRLQKQDGSDGTGCYVLGCLLFILFILPFAILLWRIVLGK